MKKAQSLSTTTIVLLALAIIIFIVILLPLLSKSSIFKENIKQDCADFGGTCGSSECQGAKPYEIKGVCTEKNDKCCVSSLY